MRSITLPLLLCIPTICFAQDTLTDQILAAGNADDDADRLAFLQAITERDGLTPELTADLEKITTGVDEWVNNPRTNYFGGQIGKTRDYDFGIAEGSPFYPLTHIYRGRMVFALTIQSGNIWSYPDRRTEWFGIARDHFRAYSDAFPENRIARMYLGEPIPWEKAYAADPKAPEWANLQRDGLESIADIVEWWIDNRLQENGEFGGGWGDDCEMWRWWVPVMLGFESANISEAQGFFSNALMGQEHMAGGYMSRMTDVEHSAEDSTDAILPMMHLDPDSELWQGRARRLAELMKTLWTGRNERGFLQFKSTYFTVDTVHEDTKKACDTPYHTRAIQPALVLWQRTGDEELGALFTDWMDTWVEATAREENGKPAGIIPAALHWPEGTVGGLSPDWWDPQNHGEPTLYEWPSSVGALTDALLLTYRMTGDEKYLEPILSMARARMDYVANPPENREPGSLAWCASRMGFLNGTLAKYRMLTGDTQFDELLGGGSSSYLRYRLTGDSQPMLGALSDNALSFAQNFERYTGEVRWTDRVLRFPAAFRGNVVLAEPQFEVRSPNTTLLYSTVTGDPGGIGTFPMNAVRWLTPPREIAALVTDAGPNRFEAELYHFGNARRGMAAEFYMLEPGQYTLTLTIGKQRKPAAAYDLSVDGPRTMLAFTVPGRKLCRVTAE